MGVASSWRRLANAWGAALAFLFASGGPASAEQKYAWTEFRTNQGCTFYAWAMGGNSQDDGLNRDWDGPCLPGKPINGQGTLSTTIKPGSGLAGSDIRQTGVYVDGVADGTHTFISSLEGREDRASDVSFTMGCFPDFDGGSGFAHGCTPRGRQLAAAEQAVGQDAKHVWVPVKTDAGCVYYLSILSDRIDSILEMRKKSVWSGEACQTGQPINGGGTLVVSIQPDGYPATKSIQTGMMVNGVWDGPLAQDDFAFTMKMGCPLNEHGKVADCTPYHTATQSARPPKDSPAQRTSSVNLDEDPWAANYEAPMAPDAPAASKADNNKDGGPGSGTAQGPDERVPDTSTGQPGGAIVGGNIKGCTTRGFASLECQRPTQKPEPAQERYTASDRPLTDAQKMVIENRRRSEEVKAAMARLQATGSSRPGVSNERNATGQPGAGQQGNANAPDGGTGEGGVLGVGGGGFAGAAGGGAACDTSSIERDMQSAQVRHSDSVVRQMKALMWGLERMIDKLAGCPNSAAQIAEYQRTYDTTKRSCGQLSTTGSCSPEL